MKQILVLISFVAFAGCKINTQKLQISAIQTVPKRVAKENSETGTTYTFTSRNEITERFAPQIFMLSKTVETLEFRIQGNINSSGHTMSQVRKIRFEKGEQYGNTITLRYFVEIKKIPGKENEDVRGYNYTKDEKYKIPNDVKLIQIELYEDRLNDTSVINPVLIAQHTFNFFARI